MNNDTIRNNSNKTDISQEPDSNPGFKEDRAKSKFAPKQIGGVRWEVILSRMKSPAYDLKQLLVSFKNPFIILLVLQNSLT